jgi:uncharacterized protein YndB with AHSA1/START domain
VALLVRHRSRIPAPVTQVWEIVADPFRRPEWMAGIAAVHGEPAGNARCLTEQRFQLDGQAGLVRFKAKEEVTAVWPGTMIAFHGESGPASYLLTLTLSEVAGEETSLAWEMEFRPTHEPPSLPVRLLVRLIRCVANRLARRSLANLRGCFRQVTRREED